MKEISKNIADLSSEKRELLELLLKKEGVELSQAIITPRLRESDSFPLSYGQKALWFLQQLEPDGVTYNIVNTMRVHTHPEVSALRHAFQKLVDRHPSFRTTFHLVNGNPVQRIHDYMKVCFQEVDASTWSEVYLYDHLVEEARGPFNLEQGPLLRVRLFAQSECEYVLQLVMHHIVTDLWSSVVFIQELGVLYQAEKAGVVAPLAPLALQYTDYVLWQEEMLAGREGEKQWAYWQKQLAGELPVLNLPTDRPRPLYQTHRGASQSLNLHANTTQQLKVLAQANGATLYMILLAAYEVLLHRYTAQETLLIGSPTSGRSRAELASIVGYFVNPVVLRADCSGNPTFSAFLGQVRQTVLDAFENQDYPFALLAERLHPTRDFSRSPLFQTMFVYQKAQLPNQQGLMSFVLGETGARMDIGDLPTEFVAVYKGVSQFDLRLTMAEVDEGLLASFNYNTDLFDATTITRMLGHFEALLKGIAADSERCLSDLPLLTEAERHQLLVEWNDTRTDYPRGRCIHQLFEDQVERTPDATALVFDQEHLTYEGLNRRSNQLAHHLRTLGVGPEVLVGICVERSLEMVVGMLAVLKAGGAYVPLDPTYPKERLSFLLEDAQVLVLLTQDRLLKRLPRDGARVISLDTGWDVIARESAENLDNLATANNLAYVIYTSGSTGVPKGAAIEHHSAVNLLYWAKEVFDSDDIAAVLAASSICFDCPLFEMFCPLSWGGKVILAENVLSLPTLPEDTGVTLISATPTAMAGLMRIDGVPASVRVVNLSGEALQPPLVQQLYEGTTVQKVLNLLGASEATTYSSCALLERDANGPATVGRPIANTQLYILDGHLQPVPVGVTGELHIGGAGLARGYLNRPDLTAEKFIPNPFSDEPGARIYKMGDFARYLPDGTIDFLGRIDHQVKVRGFRIEMGEVETVLAQHPAVREVIVVAREDTLGDRRLVAYIVPAHIVPAEPQAPTVSEFGDKRVVAYIISAQQHIPTVSELRSFLREKLPEYMVPSSFVTLDAFPLTANGKIDRQSLPAPEQTQPELEKDFVAPCTPAEDLLAGIWAEVLGLERLGVYNNFFDLGGHSLLATKIISRVQEVFQVQLPLRSLFETPTVAGLAGSIDAAMKAGQRLQTPRIERVSRAQELPLSFVQEHRLAFEQWARDQSILLKPFHSFLFLRITGLLDVTALERSLNEIVRRHEVFRTTFHIIDGRPAQLIVPDVTFTMLKLSIQEPDESKLESQVWELATEEGKRPFNLEQDPLLRATLLRLSEVEHVLLLIAHHIIYDAWSGVVLLRELAAIYQALSTGAPSVLPEPSLQYADFAYWQRQWLRGEVLEELLSYWKRQLDGIWPVPELELPMARPLPEPPTYRGAAQSLAIRADLLESLKELSRRKGVTLYMLFLAALKALLHLYTGKNDIGLLSPIANRNRRETESMIGWFANLVVLRTDLSGNPSFSELLQRVRDVTLGAHAHQDLPFPKLLDALEYRNQSRRPYVFFSMPSTGPIEAIQLPNLTLTPVEINCFGGVAEPGIELQVTEMADGLNMVMVYETDRFDAAAITQILRQFQSLLEAIVANPEQRLSDYLNAIELKQP